MVVVNPAKNIIGPFVKKKLGELGNPDPKNVLGIYRVRSGLNGVYCEKMNFYTPFNPQTVPQQANRSKFSTAIASWQALTESQQASYNIRAKYKSYSGYNLYISEYMLS